MTEIIHSSILLRNNRVYESQWSIDFIRFYTYVCELINLRNLQLLEKTILLAQTIEDQLTLATSKYYFKIKHCTLEDYGVTKIRNRQFSSTVYDSQ